MTIDGKENMYFKKITSRCKFAMFVTRFLDQSSENRSKHKQGMFRANKFKHQSTERPLKRNYKSVKVTLETKLQWIPITFEINNYLNVKNICKKKLVEDISSTYNPVNTVDWYIEPLNLRVSFWFTMYSRAQTKAWQHWCVLVLSKRSTLRISTNPNKAQKLCTWSKN